MATIWIPNSNAARKAYGLLGDCLELIYGYIHADKEAFSKQNAMELRDKLLYASKAFETELSTLREGGVIAAVYSVYVQVYDCLYDVFPKRHFTQLFGSFLTRSELDSIHILILDFVRQIYAPGAISDETIVNFRTRIIFALDVLRMRFVCNLKSDIN